MQRQPCKAMRKDGKPCRSFALPGTTRCIAHSPDRQSEMRAIRQAGGKAKSSDARAARQYVAMGNTVDAHELPALLIGVGMAAVNGDIEPGRAHALAACVRSALQVAEAAGFDSRLREMEMLLHELESTVAAE